MAESWTHELEKWHDFFLLIGTAGVTLTGLLFVVVSLGPGVIARNRASGVRAFVSPNAVYFTTALVVAAVLLVPALSPMEIGALLCVGALAALAYLGYTKAHAQWRQSKLDVLDWIWFVGLPFVAYLLLFFAGAGFLFAVDFSMHAVGLALILLLVIGIRNAWDLVIFISHKQHE